MTTEVATTTGASTALTIAPDQGEFSPQQIAALEQLGVADAAPGDLAVFFHVAKRSGLDPFARQIHMVTRFENVKDENDQWHKVPKQTIQTGIDGYRLIARRAADRAGIAYHLEGPTWFDHEGREHPIWIRAFGEFPAACKVTVVRDGQAFPATVMFGEYVQTTGRGENMRANRTWASRPAGQLAKCAEALALRMAFPQDLSGFYVDAEVDVMEPVPHRVVEPGSGAPVGGADRLRGRLRAVAPDDVEVAANTPTPTVEDVVGPEGAAQVDAHLAATMGEQPAEPGPRYLSDVPASNEQTDAIMKGFRALKIRAGAAKAAYVERVVGRLVLLDEMNEAEAAAIIDAMEFDKAHPEPDAEGAK